MCKFLLLLLLIFIVKIECNNSNNNNAHPNLRASIHQQDIQNVGPERRLIYRQEAKVPNRREHQHQHQQIRDQGPHHVQHPHPHPQQTFQSRAGSLRERDSSYEKPSRGGIFSQIRNFFTGGSRDENRRRESLPPKLRDPNRVPRPPKYPLYDLDSISLATPPPAPAMHPISSLPADQFGAYNDEPANPVSNKRPAGLSSHSYNNNKEHNIRRDGRPHPHRRGPPPRGERPRDREREHHHRNKGPLSRSKPEKKPSIAPPEFIDSPMASNIKPVVTSPSLGRPLSLEEYMQRPETSYVDDPWNFDPFKNEMNAGVWTSGLKYNYDPLGTSMTQETSNSPQYAHLDPQKLSFPGDSFFVRENIGGYDGDKFQQVMNTHLNANANANNYESTFGGQDLAEAGSSISQQRDTPTQKIEFTIETKPDGSVNIESPQINGLKSGGGGIVGGVNPYTDQYAPGAGPFGPNGYGSFRRDGTTPEDMLPPPSA